MLLHIPHSDFSEGRDLRMESQISTIINYIDKQYAETMNEVSEHYAFSTVSRLTMTTGIKSCPTEQGRSAHSSVGPSDMREAFAHSCTDVCI